MDDNAKPQVLYTAPTPWYQRKILWVFALILILIPAGVYVYGIYFIKPVTPSAPTPVAKNTLEEDSSPIAFDILQNPMVYEWRGSVEGTLVAKDEKSITLKKDGEKIVVPIDPTSTKFLPQSAIVKGDLNKSLTLEEITINDFLQGDFFVFPNENGKVIGSSFIIRNK